MWKKQQLGYKFESTVKVTKFRMNKLKIDINSSRYVKLQKWRVKKEQNVKI